MKKLINNPDNVVDEMIAGYLLANPSLIRKDENVNTIIRIDAPIDGKVGVVIGGGAGHEPLFMEYVGPGMADASAHGQVFAAPSPELILAGVKAADGGKGVMLLYSNYAGDVLNFDMAQDMARDENIQVETVLINDEIASAPQGEESERRGTSSAHVIIKIAGSAAEAKESFEDVIRITKKAVGNARSLSIGLSSCSLPATGKDIFEIGDDEMEFGMGLHGEPGVERVGMMEADPAIEKLMPIIIDDLPYRSGDEVVLVINGLGATTRMEMHVANRKIHQILTAAGIKVYATEIGEFATSLEMMGLSVSLVKMDAELRKYFDAPCHTPFYRKG